MKKILWILLISPLAVYGQSKEEAFSIFENLVGGTWSIDAAWGDGTPFKQDYEYSWDLNKAIIKAKTTGVVNMETKERGHRNEGIIAWDSGKNKMMWYQFDVYGGIYEITCSFDQDKIYLEYDYTVDNITYAMRDVLEPVDKNQYNYTVTMKTEDGWQVLLSGELLRED